MNEMTYIYGMWWFVLVIVKYQDQGMVYSRLTLCSSKNSTHSSITTHETPCLHVILLVQRKTKDLTHCDTTWMECFLYGKWQSDQNHEYCFITDCRNSMVLLWSTLFHWTALTRGQKVKQHLKVQSSRSSILGGLSYGRFK